MNTRGTLLRNWQSEDWDDDYTPEEYRTLLRLAEERVKLAER